MDKTRKSKTGRRPIVTGIALALGLSVVSAGAAEGLWSLTTGSIEAEVSASTLAALPYPEPIKYTWVAPEFDLGQAPSSRTLSPQYFLERSTTEDFAESTLVGSSDSQFITDEPSDPVSTSVAFTDVAMFSFGGCAIAAGKVFCWGTNRNGSLGTGESLSLSRGEPREVAYTHQKSESDLSVGTVITRLEGGTLGSMCAASTAEVYCWGGANAASAQPTLKRVPLPQGEITALSAGQTHSCAVLDQKTAYCWGTNSHGELGRGSQHGWNQYLPPAPMKQSNSAEALRPNARIEQIAAGQNTTCLIANGKGYCTGDAQRGALGNASIVRHFVPKEIAFFMSGHPSATVLKSIVATAYSADSQRYCAASETDVFCWGSTINGGMGFPDVNGIQRSPVRILGLPAGTVQSLDSEWDSNCAIINNTSTCWGNNSEGKFGTAERKANFSATATVLPAGKTLVKSASAQGTRCWLFTDGTLECAGNASMGALARGPLEWGRATPNLQPTLPATLLAACEGTTASDGRCGLVPGEVYFYRSYFTLGEWQSPMSGVRPFG